MTALAAFATGAAATVAGALLGPVIVQQARANLTDRKPLSFLTVATATCASGLVAAGLLLRDVSGGIVALPLVVFGIACVLVDLRERRLPDALTGPILVATATIVIVSALTAQEGARAVQALLAAAALTAVVLVVKVVRNAAVGWGDIKLMPSLGAVLGWWDCLVVAALLWAVLLAGSALLSARRGPDRVVPYGPALLAGTLGAVLFAG